MTPRQLSRELRTARTPALAKRRAIVGLSLASAGIMGFLALYQFGVVRHLPDARRGRWDAERVDSSDEAYSLLWTGDAFIGATSYVATATLAAMGESDRPRTKPWLSVATSIKVLLDALVAAGLTWTQWSRHRAFCWYCLLASALTFATVPLTWGETRAAVKALRRRGLTNDIDYSPGPVDLSALLGSGRARGRLARGRTRATTSPP